MATKKINPIQEFKNIALKDIDADINQPRKFFDEHSLSELAVSVKANGVLQPIMVRPKGKRYLLVYGERRFKAAAIAALKEIPAIVRELTDAEALDMQITENLQRKDVHPMEEAVAFKRLLDTLTIEDIALKVGKSESFVAKRLKLTDLVEDAQQIFFLDKISISQAIKLARLEASVQEEILKEMLPQNWKKLENFNLKYGVEYFFSQKTSNLNSAIFKLNDKKLYPEAGACTKCPFNSSNSPLLFDDGDNDKICTKDSCFNTKTLRQQKLDLEKFASDPTTIVVLTSNYLTTEDKSKVAMAKEMGINILHNKDFFIFEKPDAILDFDNWKEEIYYEDEDETEEDVKRQYDEYVEELKEEWNNYEKELASNDIISAVDILSHKDVKIKIRASAKRIVDSGTGNADDIATKEEIEKIKAREERAKELDAEKVWLNIIELAKADEAGLLKNIAELSIAEIKAFVKAVDNTTNYTYRKHIEKIFKDEQRINGSSLYSLCRLLILDKLIKNHGSHLTSDDNKIAYNFIKNILPQEVTKIELDQEGITAARQERVAKRIKALEEKLN
jgi:ParB family chromosome partitioning protein